MGNRETWFFYLGQKVGKNFEQSSLGTDQWEDFAWGKFLHFHYMLPSDTVFFILGKKVIGTNEKLWRSSALKSLFCLGCAQTKKTFKRTTSYQIIILVVLSTLILQMKRKRLFGIFLNHLEKIFLIWVEKWNSKGIRSYFRSILNQFALTLDR